MRRAVLILTLTTALVVLLLRFEAASSGRIESESLSAEVVATEPTTSESAAASEFPAETSPSAPAPAPQQPEPEPTEPEPELDPVDQPAEEPVAENLEVPGSVVNTRWGPVQVTAVVEGGVLVDVIPVQLPDADRRSIQINRQAEPILRERALAAQSAEIDNLSGATITWEGYTESLRIALAEVGL